MKETQLLFVRFDQSKLMGWMTMMTTFPNIINELGEAVGRLTVWLSHFLLSQYSLHCVEAVCCILLQQHEHIFQGIK